MSDYHAFLERRAQVGTACGFEPYWIPDCFFPFQRHLTEWDIRRGRAAVLADCGMGKTPIQLVTAENTVRHTNRPYLLLCPLAVSHQTVREAEKFGVEAVRSQDGKFPPGARVVVTNYERLHYFRPDDFGGCGCDESSCLKDAEGSTRAAVTEFLRTLPYRHLYTATAAPNDHDELGTHAEALGEMGHRDMLTRYFREKYADDHRGWSRKKYHLRPHAARDFWRWVCSWARACRRPSDLGFDDGPFVLPELITREHEVSPASTAPGWLFDVPAVTLQEQRQEQRRTLRERCEKAAELVSHQDPAICWCHLNDEGDLLEELIPGSVQVAGKDSDDAKEEKLLAFVRGEARVLVTKPSLAGFGLNLQHCAHQVYFPSHSWEQFYQGTRRSWRFGQKRPVVIDLVTTKGNEGVLANLLRKQEQADRMFAELVRLMNDSLRVGRTAYGEEKEVLPAWL